VSLVSVASAVAPMTMSPLAAWLITQMDGGRAARHRRARMGDARSAAPRAPAAAARRPGGAQGRTPAEPARRVLLGPVRRLALTFFACCAAHAGPIFHTVPTR